ncbi:MAG: hypothetical protein FWC79_03410 [Oscillospiraceae bacterium]|nr:hypothetical protein [Oscillospiraceae bacterium]
MIKTKNKRNFKTVVFLLLIALVVTLVPVSIFAYAEEADGIIPTEGVIGITPSSGTFTVSTWDELGTAIAAASTIGQYTMIIDGNLNAIGSGNQNAITIPAGRDILLVSDDAGVERIILQTVANQRHFIVNGTLTLGNGVAISGDRQNVITNHGGITVNSGGQLYMQTGSSIRNNLSGNNINSAGVLVTGAGSGFTMNGGTISGNFTNTGNGGSNGGGGVRVNAGATFTMNGGLIHDNLTGRFGGGVYVNASTFIMNNGVISGNTGLLGGGVTLMGASANVTMNGGEIHNNTAALGGGVNVEIGTFTMNDGLIHENTGTGRNNTDTANDANRGGAGVFIQGGGTFNLHGGTIRRNIAEFGRRRRCSNIYKWCNNPNDWWYN